MKCGIRVFTPLLIDGIEVKIIDPLFGVGPTVQPLAKLTQPSRWNQVLLAVHGFLLMLGVTLDARHSPVVTCEALQCLNSVQS